MQATDPLPLHHSWPLFDRSQRFDLGLLHEEAPQVAPRASCAWHCRLTDQRLSWGDDVYRMFGLPGDATISRSDALGLYAEPSRAAMERLRGYAIRHRRGFTLDVELRPATSDGARWMRIVAAPVCADRHVTAIEGIKLDVSALYR